VLGFEVEAVRLSVALPVGLFLASRQFVGRDDFDGGGVADAADRDVLGLGLRLRLSAAGTGQHCRLYRPLRAVLAA